MGLGELDGEVEANPAQLWTLPIEREVDDIVGHPFSDGLGLGDGCRPQSFPGDVSGGAVDEGRLIHIVVPTDSAESFPRSMVLEHSLAFASLPPLLLPQLLSLPHAGIEEGLLEIILLDLRETDGPHLAVGQFFGLEGERFGERVVEVGRAGQVWPVGDEAFLLPDHDDLVFEEVVELLEVGLAGGQFFGVQLLFGVVQWKGRHGYFAEGVGIVLEGGGRLRLCVVGGALLIAVPLALGLGELGNLHEQNYALILY